MSQEKFELLKELVYKGAKDKNLAITDNALDRISLELSVIEKNDFVDYFILFSRIIEVCNELKLLRSPGRGSAAGSLVNYCLDITKINPLLHDLIFERFLNEKRKTFPDIDIDIPRGFQKLVIQKLKEKYPQYNAYFIAFSPLRETEYKSILYKNNVYKQHPCGIVITPKTLDSSVFTHNEQKYYLSENIINDTIYSSKIDILELGYLNRLQLIIKQIGNEYHPYNIPENDIDVFSLLSRGENENIFQFDSPSMSSILRDIKPNNIKDLSIINAIFRPGPIELIPTLITNKKFGYDKFDNEKLNELFEETYGILIYQETFLEILTQIAHFTYEEADVWRIKLFKAKSNEFPNIFNQFIDNFSDRISYLGQDDGDKLKSMIECNFRMTFIKSHSLSYSIIGYWGAFYKTHFNNEFEEIFNQEINYEPFSYFSVFLACCQR